MVNVQIRSASDRSFTPKSQALQPLGSRNQLDVSLSVSPWWTLIVSAHASHQWGCVGRPPGLQSRGSSCAAPLAAAVATPGTLSPDVGNPVQGVWGEAGEGPAEGGPGQDLEGPKRLRRGT